MFSPDWHDHVLWIGKLDQKQNEFNLIKTRFVTTTNFLILDINKFQ